MEIIHKLPASIVLRIIPYTYHCQDGKLLKDIENYKETRDTLMGLYSSYWFEEYSDWLVNDILSYANNYKASMYGYVYKIYTILNRLFQLNTLERIHVYLNRLKQTPNTRQFNTLLGMFNVQERNDFVMECEKHLL